VTTAVLAKTYVAIDQWSFDLGKLCGSHAFLAEKLVSSRRSDRGYS
jgi:hypothetical protein